LLRLIFGGVQYPDALGTGPFVKIGIPVPRA
jgi:hypothetical protein